MPKKTQCQLQVVVIHAETGGPTKLGSIQQNDRMLIIQARSALPYACATTTMNARLSAPPPKPWSARKPSSIPMLIDRPPPSSPRAKMRTPAASGRTGPMRSTSRPASTIAKT